MISIPELQIAMRTDTGRVRAQNEDAVAASAEHGYAVLADGMGGYRAGEVASLMAVATLETALQEGMDLLRTETSKSEAECLNQISELIVAAIRKANSGILKLSHDEPECEGMGTTLVAAVACNDHITIAHVGDSRAYRFRTGVLEQLTKDHSLLQEQIDAGLISPEQVRASSNRNLVTRAVGVDPDLAIEIHSYQVLPDDIYLLCSDGLSDMLEDAVIQDALATESTSLDNACDILVNRANESGGHDNISVVVMRILPSKAVPPTLFKRVMSWLG
jgi:protein phosphatase